MVWLHAVSIKDQPLGAKREGLEEGGRCGEDLLYYLQGY